MSSKFLLLDTTAAVSTYALATESQVVAIRHHYNAQEQAKVINVNIEHLLEAQNWQLQELDAVMICSGPGSYTGMRISYSVAKGLCYALDIPMIAVDKLSVLAFGAAALTLVALKARAGEYFIGLGQHNQWVLQPQHNTEAQMHAVMEQYPVARVMTDDTTVFEATDVVPEVLQSEEPIDAQKMLYLGVEKYMQQAFEDIAYSEPMYLKSVYTTVSKKKGFL